jgi:nucleoid DNA-binding protein
MASTAKTTQIAELVAKKTGLSMKDSKNAVKETLSAIGTLLKKNDRVAITGIGAFSKKVRPASKGGKKAVNPFTKEPYVTKAKPAKTTIKFRAAKNFF